MKTMLILLCLRLNSYLMVILYKNAFKVKKMQQKPTERMNKSLQYFKCLRHLYTLSRRQNKVGTDGCVWFSHSTKNDDNIHLYLSQFLYIHDFPPYSHIFNSRVFSVLRMMYMTRFCIWLRLIGPSFLLFSLLWRALIRTAWGIRVRTGGRRGGGGRRAGTVIAVTATVFRWGWGARGIAAVRGRVIGRAGRITTAAAGTGGGPKRKQHVL